MQGEHWNEMYVAYTEYQRSPFNKHENQRYRKTHQQHTGNKITIWEFNTCLPQSNVHWPGPHHTLHICTLTGSHIHPTVPTLYSCVCYQIN